MIASLPMYDTPATAGANDRLWQTIRKAYGRGPEKLDRQRDPHQIWADPDLVFSQTCGLPYRSGLHQLVTLVGTPDYRVDGCPSGFYNSSIVVRANDPWDGFSAFSGARLARNDVRSQSGWAAFAEHIQLNDPAFCIHPDILETGSHAASIEAVASGAADIAAIDAVTWALLLESDPRARLLRVLCQTRPTPGLPYVTGKKENAKALFEAISTAIKKLSASDRAQLRLHRLVRIPQAAYLQVPMPPV